jgi:ketosteroid isomerase-like protein
MPSRPRVEQLIAAVMTGNHADAIAAFYTEDATMQELASPPRAGLANLVARERKLLEQMASVITHRPDFYAIDGDRVAIHWVFDFTHKDGRKRTVDEVAIQTWQGDKIAAEQFFYDPAASAWK